MKSEIDYSMSRRVTMVFVTVLMSVFMLACGSGDEEGAKANLEPSASQVTPDAGSVVQQVKALSIEAKKCLDLTKAGQYEEAMDPCERALRNSTGAAMADVMQAYDEARSHVVKDSKAAAREAAAGHGH
jgi:hypothetical protein